MAKIKRLLTPKQMLALQQELYERDGDFCIGRRLKNEGHPDWQDHVCGGRHRGPLEHVSIIEAAHQVPQRAIAKEYALGGVVVEERSYRPIKPHERGLLEPQITASEIATDVDLCIPLCELLHQAESSLTPKQRFQLVAHNADALETAANWYSLFHRLDREFDYSWGKLRREHEASQ